MARANGAEIKVVGKNGQISLGRSYAGKALQVSRRKDGSVLLTVRAIPQSQLWIWKKPERSRIDRALEWTANNPRRETDLDELLKKWKRHNARPSGHNRIRLDLNTPAFQDKFLSLEPTETKQVMAHSLGLSQRFRALAFREGDYLCLMSLHLDHDSAYN